MDPVNELVDVREETYSSCCLHTGCPEKNGNGHFLYNFGLKQCSIFILSLCLPYYMQILNPRFYDSILENERLIAVFLFRDFSECSEIQGPLNAQQHSPPRVGGGRCGAADRREALSS